MTMYHPPSSVFVTNKAHSGAEEHHESIKPEGSQTLFFRWASSILHELPVVYVYETAFIPD